jgi:hypothetical protein
VTEPSAKPTASSSAAKRGKQGLPRTGLKGAEEAALKLWDVARAGKTAKEAYAKELKITSVVGNGAWDRKVAMLNQYGLIEPTETQIGLSPLGLDLVQDVDEAKRTEARRRSVRKVKPFEELISRFDGTELPTLERLTSTLRFEYQKTEDQAAKGAEAFVESLQFAGFLDPNRIVRKNGQQAGQELPDDSDGDEEDEPEDELDALDEDSFDESEEEPPADELEEEGPERPGRRAPRNAAAASLAVTLDLSAFRADEVIKILRELGFSRR